MSLQTKTIEDRLVELNISLPNTPKPSGNYDPYSMVPPLLYLSGITPKENGVCLYKGKVGREFSKEEGYQAAKKCIVNHLGTLKATLGDLERIEKIIKVIGFINADPEFEDLPYVLNGASDFLVELFGEKGRHARSAIGVTALPGGAAVEVEMIIQYKI